MTTKFNDVSLELRNKIRKDMIVNPAISYSNGEYVGKLKFEQCENELYKECRKWISVIKSYVKVSYDCYRHTQIGRFYGIRPVWYNRNSIKFSIESVDESSWRDWFDQDGKLDGHLTGVFGKIIKER